jgi:hypothetical protein
MRAIGWSLVGLLAVLAPLCSRAGYEGQAELARADEAAAAGRVEDEIIHLGRAARWRTPWLSHDETARARLLQLGRDALAGDEAAVALVAFREVRRALLATRTSGVADPQQLQEANDNIATLMAAQEERLGTDVGGTGDPRAWHLAQLQAPVGPTTWRATAAALAFVVWLVTAGGFMLRGLDAAGRLRARAAVRWGIASLAALVAWTWLLVTVRG